MKFNKRKEKTKQEGKRCRNVEFKFKTLSAGDREIKFWHIYLNESINSLSQQFLSHLEHLRVYVQPVERVYTFDCTFSNITIK